MAKCSSRANPAEVTSIPDWHSCFLPWDRRHMPLGTHLPLQVLLYCLKGMCPLSRIEHSSVMLDFANQLQNMSGCCKRVSMICCGFAHEDCHLKRERWSVYDKKPFQFCGPAGSVLQSRCLVSYLGVLAFGGGGRTAPWESKLPNLEHENSSVENVRLSIQKFRSRAEEMLPSYSDCQYWAAGSLSCQQLGSDQRLAPTWNVLIGQATNILHASWYNLEQCRDYYAYSSMIISWLSRGYSRESWGSMDWHIKRISQVAVASLIVA